MGRVNEGLGRNDSVWRGYGRGGCVWQVMGIGEAICERGMCVWWGEGEK